MDWPKQLSQYNYNFHMYFDVSFIGGPNYAAIAGGIVGGILLIICIIVGVFLLRYDTTIVFVKYKFWQKFAVIVYIIKININ